MPGSPERREDDTVGRPEKPIDPSAPYADLANTLRALREKSAAPFSEMRKRIPYRELADRAHCSRSSLSEAASGRCLPSLKVMLAYVRGCLGELTKAQEKEWERLWTEARDKAKGNRS